MSNQFWINMSSSVHWATHYIGLPWHAGARGPGTFDCWGLFLAIQREHFGRDLPEIPVDANDLRTVVSTFRDHPERLRWASVAQPAEGLALSAVAATVVSNYQTCHENTEQLKALQDWIRQTR